MAFLGTRIGVLISLGGIGWSIGSLTTKATSQPLQRGAVPLHANLARHWTYLNR